MQSDRVEKEEESGEGEDALHYPTALDDVDGWKRVVTAELGRLDGAQHERKKKDTILALVDARLAGVTEESVWRRAGTCNRSTWHEKWKKDRLIAEVLENVYRAAAGWKDGRAAAALAEAAEMLKLESPNSVRTVVFLRDRAKDEKVRIRAALGILDRADVKTATKSSEATTHQVDEALGRMIEKVYGNAGDADGDTEDD